MFFVNRDKNACKKIIGNFFLENQLRPKEFSPKPKEKKVIIKQRNPRQKKEIVGLSR